ncbi:hypothetical protein ACS0TY_029922 [Phlomoides rotata]
MTARDWGGGLLVFSFEKRADRDWVIRNQPWHFDNYLFAIKPLSSMDQPSSSSITRVSMWVRFLDVPIALQTTAIIQSIATRIGTLECYERLDELVPNKFLCAKVNLDFTQPLKRGLHVRFGGETVWIVVSYESLLTFCFCCGVIGHHFRTCNEYDRSSGLDWYDVWGSSQGSSGTYMYEQFHYLS